MKPFVRFRFSLRLVVVVMPAVAALFAESWRLWGASGFVGAALTLANVAAFALAMRHGRWLPLGAGWYGAALFFSKEGEHATYGTSRDVVNAVALGWVVGWLTGWGVAVLIEDWLKRTEMRRRRPDGIRGKKDEDKS